MKTDANATRHNTFDVVPAHQDTAIPTPPVSPRAGTPADDLRPIARTGDLIMMSTLAGSAVAALAIGQHFGTLWLAVIGSGSILGLGLGAFVFGRGRALGWAALTACNVAMVALHIQLGRGTLEFHFGVFVLLGLLLVYRDARPIALAAGLLALHHVAFDRLQALDMGVYCMPSADFLKMLMHALYVVVQAGVELFIARTLRRAALESAELARLLGGVQQGGVLQLDTAQVAVRMPNAVTVKAALERMAVAIAHVSDAAKSIQVASAEIAAGNQDLSRRTETQASSLQQTAASMTQLSSLVTASTETAGQANDLAADASVAAVKGHEMVGRVVGTMQEIATSSRKISEITGVIDSIAFQTNILALNAAVEAARAGEQGRGFAVVASEVRSLAGRSASAAKEIRTLIDASVKRVEIGASQVNDAGSSMAEIVAHVQKVSQMISEMTRASIEQHTGIGEIGAAVTQLDEVTQHNAALVEESAAAAQSLEQQACALAQVVSVFALPGTAPAAGTA